MEGEGERERGSILNLTLLASLVDENNGFSS
jgi:hypothetical protein